MRNSIQTDTAVNAVLHRLIDKIFPVIHNTPSEITSNRESFTSRLGRLAALIGILVGCQEVVVDTTQAVRALIATPLHTEKTIPTSPLDYGDGWITIAASAALHKYLSGTTLKNSEE